jgi:hypothetical protein
MKEVVVQEATEPMKSAGPGALRLTINYQSYGCAAKLRQRDIYMSRKRFEL